jgi:hypothetical protein
MTELVFKGWVYVPDWRWWLLGPVGGGLMVMLLAGRLASADFYVATNGYDAWSGRLAVPNRVLTDGPFATVHRARDAVRELKTRADVPRNRPIEVQVRGGFYPLEKEWRLQARDSGTAEVPIIYAAYPGEEPILSGGRLITDWREVTPGRWEVLLPEVAAGKWNFSQLYINDERRPRPLVPANGYFFIEGQAIPTHGDAPDRFRFGEGDLLSSWQNLTNVEITTFHLWTMDRFLIRSVDEQKQVVTLQGPSHSADQAPLARGNWYRLENVREALKEPGQWYLDRKTGVLTCLAKPGENFRKARVIAPRLERIISLTGMLQEPVQYLYFRGLTLAHNGWNNGGGYGFAQADAGLDSAFTANHARQCRLEKCVVRHTATYAVDWRAGCHGNQVEGCELFDLGAGGVKVGPIQQGAEAETNQWSSGTVIRDNLIAHGGRVFPGAVGIWIGHASSNRVEQNTVMDFYYSGISVGWNWGEGFSPAHHNLIASNHVYRLGQGALSDLAGIYTLGESPGTIVRGNHIHDTSSARYGGWGIYLDESSRHIVVENNLVHHTLYAGLHQHFGRDNCLRNNIFALGRKGQMRFANLSRSGPMTLERNIFYWTQGDLFERYCEPDQNFLFRSNFFWQANNPEPIVFTNRTGVIQRWTNGGPEGVLVDPRFKKPAKGDFSLSANSPVVKSGFVPVNANLAGRITYRARTRKLPIPQGVFPPAPERASYRSLLAINDDFEEYALGQKMLDFITYATPAEVAAVTEETAASGMKSLKLQKGEPGKASWSPQIYCLPNYQAGQVHCAFDLRIEAGVVLSFEMRDWPGLLPVRFKTGPCLTVYSNGDLGSSGLTLLKLPYGKWVHLELDYHFAANRYEVSVTLPGQAPQKFAPFEGQPDFKTVHWVGFNSLGQMGSAYYLDNFKLSCFK